MDFFKSVFAEESDSPRSESESESESKSPLNHVHSDPDPNPNPIPGSDGGGAGGWSFGGLVKTLTTKSESVIETYRRDLKEFGSGLRREMEVAQGSLENVGQAIDEIGNSVFKGTAQIISHGKDAILPLDHETVSSENSKERNITSQKSLNSRRCSQFDAKVRGIQGDVGTYCEEPEDLDDYRKWKSEFALEEKREETGSLLEETGAMRSLYKRAVPDSVDEETFWCRYFYRVYKLKQTEEFRAKLVRRASSEEEQEEDLNWDDEDDETERKVNEKLGSQEDSTKCRKHELEETSEIKKMENEDIEQNGKSYDNKMSIEESEKTVSAWEEKITNERDNEACKKVDLEKSKEETVSTSDEKASSEGKGDNGESGKDIEFLVVSSHPSIMVGEEDLGWDEIEDLSSIDHKKMDHSGNLSKADLRKRLSAAEEEEDLSWDIEDDDEPAKA